MSNDHYYLNNFMYGFGYDEVHDDYKVVVGVPDVDYDNSFRVKVKMYSLNSDFWRSIDDFRSVVLATMSGMFVNGKLHWANNTFRRSGLDIISVDLAEMKWGKVEQPYYGEAYFGWTLGVLGSDLSV
ncbi:F-box/kelch-repeat protein At3g23880-like [Solanum dulcamara]|uniref:F-box/kelch-repeat protein At3g23880-like n=1 Tax=Solanum dulcamara TaxID=45834 RepID=UPI0024850AE8|nr:F-box/kelch-repeat protein At3g23880-like [Solanum dulcamara]